MSTKDPDSIRRRGPYDVAIVGCGPVGTILAGLLGLRGRRVVVFDRETGVYPLPRAAHIDHMGLRVLQEFGCLERLMPHLLANPGTECVSASGDVLFRLPSDQPTPSGVPASMYFYQPTFDAELRRRLAEIPTVDVHLGCDVVDMVQNSDSVHLRTEDGSGQSDWYEAEWVVGCDGASSKTRELAGIERTSFGFEEQWMIFDLKLEDSAPNLSTMAVQVCDPARPRTELPMPDSRFRFEFMLMPGEDVDEMLREDVAKQRLLDPLLPAGSATIERTATYTFLGVVAKNWRANRVLLAGDAAHLMPPFLGQGMCSGIRDAENLAWKLDWVLRGRATADVLDSYESERKPHVSHIIQTAVDFGRIICVTDHSKAEERDQAYTRDPRPLDKRFRFRLPELVTGPLVFEGGGGLFPQPTLVSGTHGLDDWVGQRFLVVGIDSSALGSPDEFGFVDDDVLVCTADDLPDPEGVIRKWFAKTGNKVAVVRPDRYVMAASKIDLAAITEVVRPILDCRAAL